MERAWQLVRIAAGELEEGDFQRWVVGKGVAITDGEREELFHALDAITEDMEQEGLNLVRQRFQTFFWKKSRMTERLEELRRVGEINASRRVRSDLRAALFDWLQSVRAYLDHTRTRLRRRYGRDSWQLDRFTEVSAELFDNYFSYRFLCKLRNAQHVDFSPLSLSMREILRDGESVMAGSAQFSRDDLLAGFDGWGARVKKDLEASPEKFHIDEHVLTMMQCLHYLAYEVALIDREFLDQQVGIVDRYWEHSPKGDGVPHVVCISEGDDGRPLGIEMRALTPVRLNDVSLPRIAARRDGDDGEWSIWPAGPMDESGETTS